MRIFNRRLLQLLTHFYRGLLGTLPRSFRERYGFEMGSVFRRRIEELLRDGEIRSALARFGSETINLLWIAAKLRSARLRSRLQARARLSIVLGTAVAAGLVFLIGGVAFWNLSEDRSSIGAFESHRLSSSPEIVIATLRRAKEVEPVDRRISLLISLGPYRFHPDTRRAYLLAERSLCLSRDHRHLIEGLLRLGNLTERQRADLLKTAARRIDRSRDLAGLVVGTIGSRPLTPSLLRSYRKTISAIDLDRERRRAVAALREAAGDGNPSRAL